MLFERCVWRIWKIGMRDGGSEIGAAREGLKGAWCCSKIVLQLSEQLK